VWGKQRGLSRPYPLVCHLLDTAAAAGVMVDRFCTQGQRKVLARTGLDPDGVRRWVMMLAGWHDIGKATPGWQAMHPASYEQVTGEPVNALLRQAGFAAHDRGGFVHLLGRADRAGLSTTPVMGCGAHMMAQVVGGHHGIFPAPGGARRWWATPDQQALVGGPTVMGQARWQATRDDLLRVVEEVICGGPVVDGWLTEVPVEAAALATGVVVVADWIMSQEDVILGAQEQEAPNVHAMDAAWLRAHFAGALTRAEVAVSAAGVISPPLRVTAFTTVFKFAPRGAQVTIAEALPGRVRGAGIVVVMAPPGDGKTEAALHAAAILGEATRSTGVLMALPTMATANAAFTRVRTFLDSSTREVGDVTRVSLLHSHAALNSVYAGVQVPSTADMPKVVNDENEGPRGIGGGCGGLAEVTDWMRGTRRGMLAPSSVATIDQVLAMALRGKWQPLRLLGVTRKVVVVDETHAYDAYMQALLRRVLTWLATCGVPVVLLSATMSGRLAASLVSAYQQGLPRASEARSVAVPEPVYPGWIHLDAVTGSVVGGPVPSTGRETTLGVRLRGFDGQDSTPAALVAAVREVVSPVVDGAGAGNILVVCNTVKAAVAVYRGLRDVDPDLPVLLMHSRYPLYQRLDQDATVQAWYGKTSRSRVNGTGPTRPHRSVLVATQVVEQSLDLDMDTVVTELAPAAMLIQRAGRSHRHLIYYPTSDAEAVAVTRPRLFPVPSLTVLIPTHSGDPDGRSGVLSERDLRPYDQVLLVKTAAALRTHLVDSPAGLRIPEDVQPLIDAVYDEAFAGADPENTPAREVVARAAVATQQREVAARHVAIPVPAGVQCLSELTSTFDADSTQAIASSRYDMDTVTLLPIWRSADGRSWLDPACMTALPVTGAGVKRQLTAEQILAVVRCTVTVPVGRSWINNLQTWQETMRPPTWMQSSSLARVLVVPFTSHSPDRHTSAVGTRVFTLTTDCGLETA